MPTERPLVGFPLILLLILGCSSPTFDDALALMVTDAADYQLELSPEGRLQATVRYTYSNRTGRTVVVLGCHAHVPPVLQKKVGSEWIHNWSQFELGCGGQRVIPPGTQYRDSLVIEAALPGVKDGVADFRHPEIGGTYRLLWLAAGWTDDPQECGLNELLPLHQRISNEFQLLAP